MVKIVSNNKKAEKQLKKIADMAIEFGGFIDPDIEIHADPGSISVYSPHNKEPRAIFKMPHDVLIPFELFEIGIKKDNFYLKAASKKAAAHHITLMKAMLELYNATGQLAAFRKSSPWLAYKDCPPVMNMLMDSNSGEYKKTIESIMQEDNAEELLEIYTFFSTRAVKVSLHKNFRKAQKALMPLIDSLNHHTDGGQFSNVYTKKGTGFLVPYYKPVAGTDECFARYRRLDAFDTYLNYAFIDENTPIMRSVAVKVEIDGVGTINIRNFDGYVDAEKTPEKFKDMLFYTPVMSFSEDKKTATLSHIFIPRQGAILTLRRLLEHIILTMAPKLEQDLQTFKKHVDLAEKTILESNRRSYKQMTNVVMNNGGEETFPDLLKLIGIQTQIIEDYEKIISMRKQ